MNISVIKINITIPQNKISLTLEKDAIYIDFTIPMPDDSKSKACTIQMYVFTSDTSEAKWRCGQRRVQLHLGKLDI